jgi:threonine/homoserine efflux transporter RhtA
VSSPAQFLNPSEAAKRLGVSVKALRLYEQRGLIAPVRTAAGWRLYGLDEMARVAEIAALRELGGASRGVERLGAAMAMAFFFIMPIGFVQAAEAFTVPVLVLAGVAVGACSSVIPYVCDQLAMSRLPRASFALMLALLPATATLIGVMVLAQIPSGQDMIGVLLVMSGVAIHKPTAPEAPIQEVASTAP